MGAAPGPAPAAIRLAMGMVLLGTAGCLGGPSPPTKFYALVPVIDGRGESPAAPLRDGVTLGVGPVTVPAYLDRPQIVTRKGSDELDLADYDRWAEPLQDGIPRMLAENLAASLATNRVAIFPWPTSRAVPYRVLVDLTRFDGPLGGEIVLDARWRILASDGTELVLRRSTITEPARPASFPAQVAAMSRALGRLSQDIAAGFRELPR